MAVRRRVLDYAGMRPAVNGQRFSRRWWCEAASGFVVTLALIVLLQWMGTMQAARTMRHTDQLRWTIGGIWLCGLWVVHFRWRHRAVTTGAATAIVVTIIYALWCYIKLMRGLDAF